tara:strand:+ start:10350 stop:10973 length:624 start_codon:yes stop_codon:yes gene_type:complete
MEKKQKTFDDVYKINVNDLTEKKNGLTYLTWAHAWKLFKELYPMATYEVQKFHSGRPYVDDENFGIMCFTTVTVPDASNGLPLVHEMWLPVMDGANKAMKFDGYDYTTKYGTKSVAPASMFDINKTIMRCLVKNLAMFGLGLYIYAGEDIPDITDHEKSLPPKKKTLDSKGFDKGVESIKNGNYTIKQLQETFSLNAEQIKTIKNLK